jgi:hypothetical protein
LQVRKEASTVSRQPRRDPRRQPWQRKVRRLRKRLEVTKDPTGRQRLIVKVETPSPTAPVPDYWPVLGSWTCSLV